MIVEGPKDRAHAVAFNRIASILDSPNWHESWIPYNGLVFYLYGIWYEKEIAAFEAEKLEELRNEIANSGDT